MPQALLLTVTCRALYTADGRLDYPKEVLYFRDDRLSDFSVFKLDQVFDSCGNRAPGCGCCVSTFLPSFTVEYFKNSAQISSTESESITCELGGVVA